MKGPGRVALSVTHRQRGVSEEARPQSTGEELEGNEVVSGHKLSH